MTTRKLCYPHPAGLPGLYISGGIPHGLHDTQGLDGYWAYDFMAHGGTPIFAVEDGLFHKKSGHDPATGVHEGDVFGWSMYLRTPDDLDYYLTHIGKVLVSLNTHVKKGQVIAVVGHWPHNEGRSHTHYACRHPMGTKASQRAITNVAEATHLKVPV